jgi:hypothetical protein
MSAPARSLELSLLPEQFIIVRLGSRAPLPAWATQGRFFSVTRTPDELSIVCTREQVPEALRNETHWRAFKVRGPMALTEIGVLASLATPLAEAQISIFVVSTFETDYVLVNSEQLPDAIRVLRKAGHKIEEAELASSKTCGEGRND